MKLKASSLIAAGMLVLVTAAASFSVVRAETFSGGSWNVTFTSGKKMDSDFKSSQIADVVSGMQPGDSASFTVKLNNSYSGTTDWYMNNKVIKSLEDNSKTAASGGYTYALSFTDSSGNTNYLYNSENVGGENYIEKLQGLHEATSALEDFFYLTSLDNGKSGSVTLNVAVDGESQGNNYQDTLAELALNFAVELPAEDNRVVTETRSNVVTKVVDYFKTSFVKTSDNVNLILLYVIAAIIGILLIVIGIICICIRKRMKKGEDR